MTDFFEHVRTPQWRATVPLEERLAADNAIVAQALWHVWRELAREVYAYAAFAEEKHSPALARDAEWMHRWLDGEAAVKLTELQVRLEDWALGPHEALGAAEALKGLTDMVNVIRQNARLHNESSATEWLQVMEWIRQIPHSAAEILTRRGLPKPGTIESLRVRLTDSQDKYLFPVSPLPPLEGLDFTVAA
ncbi:MAG: hypothetical protein IMW99_09395 [Firmicutes bacterium]|nr:hypothetical protein [Bacillota bacterium]